MQNRKILMICLGNICRSPMAEGVLRKKLEDNNLDKWVEVDSCGFESCHLGESPYYLAVRTARRHGVSIENQRQRVFSVKDFDEFDKIYVMDNGNYRNVERYARTQEDMKKVDYLLNEVYPHSNKIVPDPWGGTEQDFEYAFNLIEKACEAIVMGMKNE